MTAPTSAVPAVRAAPAATAIRSIRFGKQLRTAANIGLALIVPITLLVVWEILAQQQIISRILYSSPSAIVQAGIIFVENGRLGSAIVASLTLWLQGLAFGAVIGVSLGFVVGLSRRAGEFLQFTLLLVQIVPSLALIPLFIIWFGGGDGTRILIVSLAVFFPVYINTMTGIRGVDPKLVEVAKALGLRDRQIVTKVIVPGALPLIFVGLRQSLKFAWVGVVGVEFFVAASDGLAFMLSQARSFSQTPVVFLGLVVLALLGVLTDLLLRLVESVVVRPPRRARSHR